ncbi:sodium-independent anion transporter [Microbacterium sp. NIBRBAC000506063]|uniref:sodium-independent anion transporter n=1 Tax=Microbacterium sp. NIBRBAC000506063 TaxID=2734618 RepID=UPI0021D44D3B|nr:sodium-independent anion transporter [Microbacterium sp. NIBRBAC000506063]
MVLDLEAVSDVDVTAAESFEGLKDWLRDHGVSLAFSRVTPPVQKRLRLLGILDDEPLHPTNRAAVEAVTAVRPREDDA